MLSILQQNEKFGERSNEMSISEIMQSAQFIMGNNGKPTTVVRQRMKNWRIKEGWTSWEDEVHYEDH